jgi:hypothetical protein
MHFLNCFVAAVLVLIVFSWNVEGQRPGSASQRSATASASPTPVASNVRASAAYAEIVLARTELESELEALLVDYTDEFPRVMELRFRSDLLKRDADRLLSTGSEDIGKFTQALGRLMVRRSELEVELWKLRQNYKDEHPDVRRAKRRVEIYDKAIKEILD